MSRNIFENNLSIGQKSSQKSSEEGSKDSVSPLVILITFVKNVIWLIQSMVMIVVWLLKFFYSIFYLLLKKDDTQSIGSIEDEIKKLREQKKDNEQREANSHLDLLKASSANINSFLDSVDIHTFYHFTDIRNLRSIIEMGGLYSWYSLVQKNRMNFPSSNELSRQLDLSHGLEEYVRLSYVDYHPMSTKVQYEDGKNLIWLEIDRKVVSLQETKFSDINATDNNVNISDKIEFVKSLNFKVFEKRYNKLNYSEKKQYQAEILVKDFIPLKYITNIEQLKRRYL